MPETSSAATAIACIYALGITTGTSTTTYSPEADVTRAQMASFLARLYKAITGTDAEIVATPFTDVAATDSTRDDIARIYGLGVTTGTSDTSYSPADNVTRAQMASFLARLYKAITGTDAEIVATPFTDVAATSSARDDIARIYGLGVTTGNLRYQLLTSRQRHPSPNGQLLGPALRGRSRPRLAPQTHRCGGWGGGYFQAFVASKFGASNNHPVNLIWAIGESQCALTLVHTRQRRPLRHAGCSVQSEWPGQ